MKTIELALSEDKITLMLSDGCSCAEICMSSEYARGLAESLLRAADMADMPLVQRLARAAELGEGVVRVEVDEGEVSS